MSPIPLLLPAPRQILPRDGVFSLPQKGKILLDPRYSSHLHLTAERLRAVLEGLGQDWELVSDEESRGTYPLSLRLLPELIPQPQGYRMSIRPEGIQILAHDVPGVFYAVCTLIQLVQQSGKVLPAFDIVDWPDFPVRGVMLDISRDKVYRMETLFELVDRLAGWKINQLQLYTEHTFAYSQHRVVWENASPMTAEEIRALDRYCQERFIELVPNQNTFGHMERWLVHEPYAHLAETHDWFETPWGPMKGPFSLQPDNPESIKLVTGLFDELLPNFSSRMVNVGCDETVDVGQGKTKARVEAEGLGRVYLDYLLRVYREISSRGRIMQFWGDIITQEADLVGELPRDVLALLWGYEADHPFDAQGAQFAAAGLPFYVCPGTSAWCSVAGRTDNCIGNIRSAAANGLKHGAIGLLTTDWGDRGHWQHLPVSWLGLAYGAALGWCLAANETADIAALVSRYAFDDPSGTMGRLAYDLGNIYKVLEVTPPNSSALFWILQMRLEELQGYLPMFNVQAETLKSTLAAIDAASDKWEGDQMQRPDVELIRREMRNTIALLRHACRRGLLLFGEDSPEIRRALGEDLQSILSEYRQIWLERNRPGGLADSLKRFAHLFEEYGVADVQAVG